MEKQLAEYRLKKAQERQSECSKSPMSNFFWRKVSSDSTSKGESGMERSADRIHAVQSQEKSTQYSPHRPITQHKQTADFVHSHSHLLTHPTFLKTVLWLILWGLFIELGFGAVYFVISLLFVIYANTRKGGNNDGGPSAYSVFNRNCERLEGTFTAEQFEKELRHGAGSVH